MRVETQASLWQAFAATLAQARQEGVQPQPQLQRHDFHHITPTQLRDTVNELIVSGQMDLDETSSLLGFMPSPLAAVEGTVYVHDDAPIDVFAKIQAAIEGALSRFEWRSADGLRAAAAALQRHQA